MTYLKRISFNWKDANNLCSYPFNIPTLRSIDSIDITNNITFFVGENGSGKSTLLESIAYKAGFAIKGGGRNAILHSDLDDLSLESIITLSWFPKITNGFFLRAETLFNYAEYLEELADQPFVSRSDVYASYGGKELFAQSHGESFMSLFEHRFRQKGLYILDEPEAALSPQRQLAFLRILKDQVIENNSQFIIATHSPIILSYPDALIYSFDDGNIKQVNYEDTEHFQLTKDFLNNRERYFKRLFK